MIQNSKASNLSFVQVKNYFLDMPVPVWVSDLAFVPNSEQVATYYSRHGYVKEKRHLINIICFSIVFRCVYTILNLLVVVRYLVVFPKLKKCTHLQKLLLDPSRKLKLDQFNSWSVLNLLFSRFLQSSRCGQRKRQDVAV